LAESGSSKPEKNPQQNVLTQVQEKLKQAEAQASDIAAQGQPDAMKIIRRAQALASELQSLEREMEADYQKLTMERVTKKYNEEAQKIVQQGTEDATRVKTSSQNKLQAAIKIILDSITNRENPPQEP